MLGIVLLAALASSAAAQSAAASYRSGLVGLWNFNSLTPGTSLTSSGSGTVIRRATVPCRAPPSASGLYTCPDAWLTGSGGPDVPALTPGGKYGSALNIAPGLQNWAQIFNAPPASSSPATTGFTVAGFVNLNGLSFGGTVWERMFNQADLNLFNNYVECRMPPAAAVARWTVPLAQLNTGWHHYACTFDPATSVLRLFVDGMPRGASGPTGLTSLGGSTLSFFRRGGSPGNLAQYASATSGFTGWLDDFALWERPLTAPEVAALAFAAEELAPAVEPTLPARVSTYTRDIVGLWSFDTLAAPQVASSNTSAPIIRGTVLCGLPAAGDAACPRAYITGNAGPGVPALAPGKYDSALSVAAGLGNWAQIYSAPLPQKAPGATGFSVAAWVRVTANNNNGGFVWERLFDNMNLLIYNSRVSCTLNNAAVASWAIDIQWTIGQDWHHFICSYDNVTTVMTLFVDGLARAASPTLGISIFSHGELMPFGVFRRATWGPTSNLAQYADATATFAGLVDDMAMWSRSLTPAEAWSLATAPSSLALAVNPPTPSPPPPPSPSPSPPPSPPTAPPPPPPPVKLQPRSVDIGAITSYALDLATRPYDNDHIDASAINAVTSVQLADGGAAYQQSVDVAAVSTWGDGLVALYSFDSLAPGTTLSSSSSPSAVIVRGTVPCRVPTQLGASPCPPAYITGAGGPDVPGLAPGKFGNGLSVAAGLQNWGQIFAAPLPQDAPGQTGFSVGTWVKITNTAGGNGGTVFERMFDNIKLNIYSQEVQCAMNNNLDFRARWQYADGISGYDPTVFHHYLCTFDNAAGQLALYVDGVRKASAAVSATSFSHGQLMAFSLFRRAGWGVDSALDQYANPAETFAGIVDDFAIWNRALTAAEASGLAAADGPLQPAAMVSVTSLNLVRSGPNREAGALRVSWEAAGALLPSSFVVHASTDGGANWCKLTSGEAITDFLHADTTQQQCLFPTVSVKFSIRWAVNAALKSFMVEFLDAHPQATPRPSVDVGMNLVGHSYWAAHTTFSDLFQGNAKSLAEYPALAGENSAGFPLAIDKAADQCTTASGGKTQNYLSQDCPYWQPGMWHFLADAHLSSAGTYAFIIRGCGDISLSFDITASLKLPNADTVHTEDGPVTVVKLPKTATNTNGILLRITLVNASFPITAIQVYRDGCCNAAGKCDLCGVYDPQFLSTLSGFKAIRAMDWGATNGANLAHWKERPTLSTSSQGASRPVVIPISSISCWDSSSTPFMMGDPAALVKTARPHGLATGQIITISGSTGGFSTSVKARSFDMNDVLAYVIDESTFAYALQYWGWAAGETLQPATCQAGSSGWVKMIIQQGVAFEHMTGLAQSVGADLWVNVPHAATPDFIAKMAQFFAANLPAGRKLMVEYSNEVWNWLFSQTQFASRMAWEDGLNSAAAPDDSAHLKWHAKKSAEVFKAFRTAFAGDPRLVCVMAVQAGGGSLQLQQLKAYGQPADALAIAPYFGASMNSEVFPLLDSISGDELLDLARRKVVTDTFRVTRASAAIAAEHGIPLIAYEGGSHMGGGGSQCGSDSCANVDALQQKFMAANRDMRMAGLYHNMLRAWHLAGGGLFSAYSHIGGYSKYGSWGALEFQSQDPSSAPKYLALRKYAPAV